MTTPSNPSIAETFKPGEKLAGCYTLKESLGEQGFCYVWLARDEELNRDIAMHFVPDAVAADSRAMSELKQEAKRNRQLIHPRIVRVHDMVEEEKWAAVSMDHVQGDSYSALQEKRPKRAFDPAEVALGISELCQTIEDAHRIDLLHRDLTPDNILAGGNGVIVQKFGISRVILDALARAGREVETSRDLGYISPQQLDGERVNRADDIYSLGACIYSLLTGAAPFSEGDIIAQVRRTVPPRVSERRAALGIDGEPVPRAWDDVIAACLAKNFEERPKSAAEIGARFASASVKAAPLAGVGATASAAAETAPAATMKAKVQEAPKQEPKEEPAREAEAQKELPIDLPKDAPAESQKTSGRDAPGRPQKRPWAPGPGRTPVIKEATIVSKTAVSKQETKGEPEKTTTPASATGAPEPAPAPAAASGAGGGGIKKGGPGGPVSPSGFPLRAFVAVEGENKPKGKSPAGLIAGGVVLLLIIVVGYLVARNNPGAGEQTDTAVATSGSNGENSNAPAEETSQSTNVGVSPSPSTSPVATPVNLAAVSPSPRAMPSPAASSVPEAATGVASPTVAPEQVAALAAMTGEQAQQLIAEKARAISQAKAALADAEKAAQAKSVAQAQAAAMIQQVQAAAKQKADAAAVAKKAADAAAATLKEQQDTFEKAQADADAAQKAAAEKAQAVEQMRKSLQATVAAAQQQQTAQAQAQADADAVAKTLQDQQQAADAAAKAAADAEKSRIEQSKALNEAQAALAQLQTGLTQAQNAENGRRAAEEAARIQKQQEAAAAQVSAAAKAAADAERALEAAKKAVADAEKAQADAEARVAAARNGAPPVAVPVNPMVMPARPQTTPATAPAIPRATPAAMTTPAATGSEQIPAAPTLSVRVPNPHLKVDQALSNSLGMRFAPAGKVLFSIWLTRVQDFAAFAKATGYKGTAWQDPGFKQTPDHPVVNVSWNDANQFCLWLTEKEHHDGILSPTQTYRLPTDMEWSYAVGLSPEIGRTPESRDMDVPDVYPWGTDWPPPAGAGNYTGEETDSDVAIKGYNDGFAWTSPVGSFKPNKFGLYDMGGNVWEWCGDWWNSEQKQKVVRGGSWDNGALKLSLLSSCRERASADLRADNYGFRVVLAEETTKLKPKRR